jgi:mono/diheme cytochrome c family protein
VSQFEAGPKSVAFLSADCDNICKRFQLSIAASLGLLLVFCAAPSIEAAVEFNRDIRPILSDKCFTCHGPDAANRKTKLRFDLESSAKAELRNGVHAIAPRDPDNSELFRRITSDNKAVRMPPASAKKEKLTEKEIALLRAWIAEGAPWEAFWSFAPPEKPALPIVAKSDWVRNPVDHFILSRLEREQLRPSPEADGATLMRRVSLDLTGLSPTPAEVDAFLADRSPSAYEKVVDRLLASPRYGEHMAFRWMEAARYGDTNGYQTDGPRDMWRWRDWVIDAFNRNMPYDQFTIEQLAGDLLPNATLEQRIATGFNRNQRTTGEGGIIPEEYRVEYVADRAQTTSAVWMGLTTGCARCHDHKYDPIFQKDFYRLFAYFNQIPDEKGFVWNYGNEEPLVKAPLPEQAEKLAQLDRDVETASKAYDALQPSIHQEQGKWEKTLLHSTPDWTPLVDLIFPSPSIPLHWSDGQTCCPATNASATSSGVQQFDGERYLESSGAAAKRFDFGYLDPFTFAAFIKPDSPDGAILSHSEDYFEGTGHGLYLIDGKIRLHLIHRWTDLGLRVESSQPVDLHRWQHVSVSYDGNRKASGVCIYIDGKPQQTRILFDQNNEPLPKKASPFRIGAGGGKHFLGSIADARVFSRAVSREEASALAVRQSLSDIAATPPDLRTAGQRAKVALAFLDSASVPAPIVAARKHLFEARLRRDHLYKSIPTVMVMADSPTPRQTFVLNRGAYDNPGEPVTPGVPGVLPPFRPEWPNNRLGLAKWLVDRQNPLTARVTVNRFWQSFFGLGIVKTVDDFGSQGEPPVHPELLDWLATTFMDSGWNVKALQKTIVMSATYRQSSAVSAELLQRDPDNRLLARGPRLRLGPNVSRDQALAAAGLLVEKIGGPSVKPYQPAGLWQELAGGTGYVEDKGEGLYRRSLYTYWKRTVAPPFMTNFDSPNREQCAVFENRTNSPLQALNLMNDTGFVEAARKLAERMLREGGASPATRATLGYRLLLAKAPQPAQQRALMKALDEFTADYRAHPEAARRFLAHGRSAVASDLGPVEFAAYTGIASLLLNLDETITKQ